jgi:hypothetical protein
MCKQDWYACMQNFLVTLLAFINFFTKKILNTP